VLADADGSLLIVDTGGWYKLCCPSSQLAKGDVPGGLYRVRRERAAGDAPPKLAGDARAAAYARLTQPPSLADYTLPATLKRAVWQGDAKSAGWFAEMVAKHAPAAATNAESANVVRVAAEGLGRLRATNATPALLEAVGHAGADVVLERALVMALIEAGEPAELRRELAATLFAKSVGNMPAARSRAALIALDQHEGGDLKPAEVVPFLGATDERLRRAADWILLRHPEWAPELAGWFRGRLGDRAQAGQVLPQVRLLTRGYAGQKLLAEVAVDAGLSAEARIAALNAMATAGLKEPPVGWKDAVLRVLGEPASGAPVRLAAVRAARSMTGDSAVTKALLDAVAETAQPADLRAEALTALPAGRAWGEAEFTFARRQIAPEQPPAARAAVAAALARAKLSPDQLAALTGDLRAAGPVEFGRLLEAFDPGGDEALGAKLLAALKDSSTARALPPGQLRPHFAKFPEATRRAAEAWLATLDADAAQQSARLDALLAELKALPADVRRGQAVFNSDRAVCAACHKIGYLGGDVGPDLTSISQARGERDLLEAVVYPSLSFVRSYEPVIVATKDGEEHSGVVRRDTAEELVLATGPGAEQRLARADIAGQRPGATSVMPAGLDEQLTRQELADLLAFLKNTKWGAN
ncbi:MAG: dehydrogenase, partial [Limisphaerales bacterium]